MIYSISMSSMAMNLAMASSTSFCWCSFDFGKNWFKVGCFSLGFALFSSSNSAYSVLWWTDIYTNLPSTWSKIQYKNERKGLTESGNKGLNYSLFGAYYSNIRILFVFSKRTEYEYEYHYSVFYYSNIRITNYSLQHWFVAT